MRLCTTTLSDFLLKSNPKQLKQAPDISYAHHTFVGPFSYGSHCFVGWVFLPLLSWGTQGQISQMSLCSPAKRHNMLWPTKGPLLIRAELATQPSRATFSHPVSSAICKPPTWAGGVLLSQTREFTQVLGGSGCHMSLQWRRLAYLGFFLSWHVKELVQHWYLLAKRVTAGTNLQLQDHRMSVRAGREHKMGKIERWWEKSLDQEHREQKGRWPDLSPYLPSVPSWYPQHPSWYPQPPEVLRRGLSWGCVFRLLSIYASNQLAHSWEYTWWSSKTRVSQTQLCWHLEPDNSLW